MGLPARVPFTCREAPHSIYEATVPVALCVAEIVDRPAITAGDEVPNRESQNRPPLVQLLGWLCGSAYNAENECVAACERFFDEHEGRGCSGTHWPIMPAASWPPALTDTIEATSWTLWTASSYL
ncbi:hypothetical protein [Streptomyces goshikiensis]|uniref:hypothetical protein n=1 Tax=Streptomyces goshikiensis TaxID=1942 RepID=UPI0036DEA103